MRTTAKVLAALASACLISTAHVQAKEGLFGVPWMEVLETLELVPTKADIDRALSPQRPAHLRSENLTCQGAIDELLLDATNFDFGSIFYVLLNGWYLGAWGDYGSCILDAKYGQYVLVTMEGNYDTATQALFTRGALGKYKRFATHVGMCVPFQCAEADMDSLTDHYTQMATNANWTDVTVSYRFSSRDDAKQAKQGSAVLTVVMIAVITLIVLGVIGTVIELTHIGDLPKIDYKRLDPLAKFQTIRQYEPVLMMRKRPWAQLALIFSGLRNFMHQARHPRAYQVSQSGIATHPTAKPFTRHMNVFNGIMGMSIVYATWGSTYFFSWYGVYDNPQDITKMRESFFFSLVPGAFFVVPVLFFAMAFVSTFSLLHNKPDGEGMTVIDALKFVGRRALKFLPFNIFILAWGVLMGPSMAAGPFWNLYTKAMEPCQTLWWTNLLYINNLYPSGFDEKCMPWTWFLACYVQLSFALPLLIAIYQLLPRIVANIIYGVLLVGFMALNGVLVSSSGSGLFLRFDDGVYFNTEFYAQHFMKPWFHAAAYLWGVFLAIVYLRYVHDRAYPSQVEAAFNLNSRSTRVLASLKANGCFRYPLYIISVLVMFSCYLGLHIYTKDNQAWSAATQGAFAALAYPSFAFAMSAFILCALLGRAEFVRFFFGGDIWTFFRSQAYALYMYAPIYSLNYFCGMSCAQHLDYQMMFYNFCGIFIFSLIFGQIFFVFIDRPFHAMFYFRHDMRMVTQAIENDKSLNIDHYMQGQLVGESDPAEERSPEPVRAQVGDSTTLFDMSNTKNLSKDASK